MITGGAGFIGSHVVRQFVNQYPQYQVINLDALTYAGNLENLKDIENKPNYRFVKANILDSEALEKVFDAYSITDVIHLAAESHVDRSIVSPLDFVYTNIIGTVNLLNTARKKWAADYSKHRFYHISTDEVYGSRVRPVSSQKKQLMIPAHPIRPAKLLPIILCGPTMRLITCKPSFPIALIITDLIISPRS